MLGILFNILFPQRCMGCNIRGKALCASCIRKLPTASFLEKETFAVYDYGNRLVKRAVHDLKYYRHGEAGLALARAGSPYIGEYISERLQSTAPEECIVIPIPMHSKKRGFNQSELLARCWAQELGGVVAPLIQKTSFTLPQARLNRHERLRNVENSMSISGSIDPLATYILVDDVTTTGATFAEARRALRVSSARKIICVALAHGYARK